MSDIACPKCGCEQPLDIEPGDYFEYECDGCGFAFTVEVEHEPIYTVRRKEHNWGEWRDTEHAVWRWRVCLTCDAMESRRNNDRDQTE